MEKHQLLDRFAGDGDERILLGRVLDRMEAARRKNRLMNTGFLSPREQEITARLLEACGQQEEFLYWGGYEDAERKALFFLPDYLQAETVTEAGEGPLQYLRAEFAPEERPSHRDFLGSLTALGIRRETFGDLLIGENSCDLIVFREIRPLLLEEWKSAGRARLRVSPLEAEALRIPAPQFQLIRDTVATLRLDGVISAGFSVSRSRAGELIRAGRAELNWTGCEKPDQIVRQEDVISVRGLGKIILEEVGGLSRKSRIQIVIKRLL